MPRDMQKPSQARQHLDKWQASAWDQNSSCSLCRGWPYSSKAPETSLFTHLRSSACIRACPSPCSQPASRKAGHIIHHTKFQHAA